MMSRGHRIALDRTMGALRFSVLASYALVGLALSGCVTEEIGPTELHTTAYVEHDSASDDQESTRPRGMSSTPSIAQSPQVQ